MTTDKLLTKLANQNIDVKFYQGRTPGDWFAHVICSDKERFTVGPGDFRAIINSVANLVGIEMVYADLKVHGEEAIAARNKPRKRSTILRSVDEE